jgi:hypothetical protein
LDFVKAKVVGFSTVVLRAVGTPVSEGLGRKVSGLGCFVGDLLAK